MSKYSSHQYYLNIHHRAVAIYTDKENGNLVVGSSPGHFFISLQMNEERKYFGKYAKEEMLVKQVYSSGQIISEGEKQQVNYLEQFKEQTGEEQHFFKSIALSEVQYGNAMKFIAGKLDGSIEPENYVLGFNDCTDFVQEVYHHAGLPLYFTSVFTQKELLTLGTPVALNVIRKYGAGDAMQIPLGSIEAVSKEDLANRLNISTDNIFENSLDLIYRDVPTAPTMLKFTVLVDKIKLPKAINIDSQSFEAIEDNPQGTDNAADPFNFAAMTNLLPLSENQRQQAANDMKEFFNGMMQNPYGMGLSSAVFNPQDYHQESDEETKKWAQDIVASSNEMLRNMGFGAAEVNSSNQSTLNPDMSGQNLFYPDFPLD